MEPTRLSNFLANADRICDYIPGVSTVTNIVNLVQKIFLETFVPDSMLWKSHYYTNLDEKSYTRCLVALLPLIGNLLIASGDNSLEVLKKNYGEDLGRIVAAKQNTDLTALSVHVENDKNRMMKAIQEESSLYGDRAIGCASRRLKDDEDVALTALLRDSWVYQYWACSPIVHFSNRLKNNPSFIALSEAVEAYGNARWQRFPENYLVECKKQIQLCVNKIKPNAEKPSNDSPNDRPSNG